MQPLLLHAHRTGPNPYKVAIALELLKVPYTVRLWELGDAPNVGVKSAEFTKINPNGRVPALYDPNTGVTSWESAACLSYLVRTYDDPKKPVLGLSENATAQQQADLDAWTSFLISTLGPFMGQVNWFTHYHKTKNEDALSRYREQALRCYKVTETQLEKTGGKSILETGFGVVDVHFWPWLKQHDFARLSLDDYPKLEQWFKATAKMDCVTKAYEAVEKGEKGSA